MLKNVPRACLDLQRRSSRSHFEMTCRFLLGTSVGPRYVNVCVKEAKVGGGSSVGVSVGSRGR